MIRLKQLGDDSFGFIVPCSEDTNFYLYTKRFQGGHKIDKYQIYATQWEAENYKIAYEKKV